MHRLRGPSPLHRTISPLAALALAACGGELPQSALAPAGPGADAILDLHWILTALSALVVVLFLGAMLYGLFRRRDFRGLRPPLPLTPDLQEAREKAEREGGETEIQEMDGPRRYIAEQTGMGMDDPYLEVRLETAEEDRRALPWILGAGVVFPAVVLTALFVYTMHVFAVVEAREAEPELTVEVIGKQFWWEIRYLDDDGRVLFETANEMHLPVGRRVAVRLRSPDVIHSFWIPRLAGKLDMIPGRTTQFTLQADRAGVFRGQCAEYCGLQHAKMALLAIAQPEDEFRAWMADQMREAVEPAEPLAALGREVFLDHSCKACHAVRGTDAAGDFGPDLTHVASRRTIAAAAFPNTRGHMGGWIANPQAMKPGVDMPAVPLENEHFLALLEYMMSLE